MQLHGALYSNDRLLIFKFEASTLYENLEIWVISQIYSFTSEINGWCTMSSFSIKVYVDHYYLINITTQISLCKCKSHNWFYLGVCYIAPICTQRILHLTLLRPILEYESVYRKTNTKHDNETGYSQDGLGGLK